MAALDGQFSELFDFSDISDESDAIPDFNFVNDPAACVGCAE